MNREICLMDLCTWKNVWRGRSGEDVGRKDDRIVGNFRLIKSIKGSRVEWRKM